MKKALSAPLCSAVVIPGLGQLINGQPKKGAAILLTVFTLFLVAVIWLYRLLASVARQVESAHSDPQILLQRLQEKDLTVLWFLLLAFGLLWVFSVLDAFLQGKSIDHRKGDSP